MVVADIILSAASIANAVGSAVGAAVQEGIDGRQLEVWGGRETAQREERLGCTCVFLLNEPGACGAVQY